MTKTDYIVLIVGLIAYQCYATFLVLRSDHFDDVQKRRQVIFIWAIPFLGAILVRIALNAAEQDSKRKNQIARKEDTDARGS